MDSTLRPRDIQARIRAGESPEAVAQAAQTSVDKIMPFAAPVMAERQHVAQRAQRSSVRRTGQTGGARTLGDAVAAHLRGSNVDPDGVEWDAARREDGRWALTAEFATPARSGIAEFTYDAPGNYVVADNDDAGWLLGDLREPAAAPRPGDDLTRARARRLSAVSDSELPLGDDAISMVTDETATVGTEQPVEAYLDDQPPVESPAARESAGSRHRRTPSSRPTRSTRSTTPTRTRPTPRRTRLPSRPARSPPRSAVAPRCRAGTRSCSAGRAAPTGADRPLRGGSWSPGDRVPPRTGGRPRPRQVSSSVPTVSVRRYQSVPSGHVVLRHRCHGLHRPLPGRGAARPPRGRRPRPGARGVAPAAAADDRALADLAREARRRRPRRRPARGRRRVDRPAPRLGRPRLPPGRDLRHDRGRRDQRGPERRGHQAGARARSRPRRRLLPPGLLGRGRG